MLASKLSFKEEVNRAMLALAKDDRVRFYGQSICYDGAAIFNSFEGIPIMQRVEMPVIEDFQLGFCIGISLHGIIPICTYPRMDFLVLAMNQLVNHLDKLPLMGWRPKVIIRTCVGQKTPLDAGPQHTQNHVTALRLMLKNVEVHELTYAEQVVPCYMEALADDRCHLIVENSL